MDDLAFEDAATHFERVVQLLEEHAADDRGRHVEALIALADALIFVDERAGVVAAHRAVEAARAHGTPAQLGRAVAVLAEPASTVEIYPGDIAADFDEAIAALDDDHPELRARLLALEAFKYAVYQLYGRDARELARVAVEQARRVGDAQTLADALFARGSASRVRPTTVNGAPSARSSWPSARRPTPGRPPLRPPCTGCACWPACTSKPATPTR